MISERHRQRRSIAVKLIVFLAVTGTLTFLIGTRIARVSFAAGYRLTATFDDAAGLIDGDAVKIAGAPVGQVCSIKVRNGKALVTLTIRKKYRVPADSEVAIRWRNAVGQRVVYLIPGTSPQKIKDGAHIARTRSVVDIGDLIDQLAPLSRSLDPEQLNRILTATYLALDGNDRNVTQLIGSVDQLASTIAARRATLRQLLEDYAKVTRVIARRDGQIRQMTGNLVELSDAFVRNRRLLDDSLVRLATMLDTTDRLVGGNGDQLARAVNGLTVIGSGVRRNMATLNDLLDRTGPKMRHVFAAANGGHYVRGAFLCVTLDDGPRCPYPIVLKDYQGEPQSPRTMQKILVGGD